MWLNQTILTTSVDLWWLIMTFAFWKSWIWLLLSKKNTFYCTLNLTQFSNFTVTLTLSCYQTWWDGLDLTCPSFRGLNFDDFPFFWTFERTSGSRDRPILRFIGNWWHFRNIKDGAVQLPAAKSSSSSSSSSIIHHHHHHQLKSKMMMMMMMMMMMRRRRRRRRIWWWWWWWRWFVSCFNHHDHHRPPLQWWSHAISSSRPRNWGPKKRKIIRIKFWRWWGHNIEDLKLLCESKQPKTFIVRSAWWDFQNSVRFFLFKISKSNFEMEKKGTQTRKKLPSCRNWPILL